VKRGALVPEKKRYTALEGAKKALAEDGWVAVGLEKSRCKKACGSDLRLLFFR